ncbi:ArsC family reductase [Methylomicrobium sp. Wu6]|uniref:ArsC family reductase n=1 Tax=Methylomicrobium sp. Wu6 TaxID=3107928 RepID=UPI002DD62944|nr:ArsC family reductase [Methylomicrobium sp. Wu6]MEC4747686.1 ArsC family reductase [Methylomicrobium sp. Wu6]
MTITLYGIKTCDTCKKARQWLEQNGIEHRFHDYRVDGLSPELLEYFINRLGWEKMLNKSSTSWRQLSAEQQTDLNRDKAKQLMLETPTLIKRPILETGNALIVGFKAEQYESLNLSEATG